MKHYLFVVIVVAFWACKKEDTTSVVASEAKAEISSSRNDAAPCNIFPLDVRNYWYYSTKHFSSSGVTEVSDHDTIRAQKIHIYYNNAYYYLNPLWIRNNNCSTISIFDTETKKEFKINNNSTTNDNLVSDVPYDAIKKTHGVQIYWYKDRVSLRKYNCYKVRYLVTSYSTGLPFSNTIMYISEGIGLVRTEEYRYTSSGKTYLMTTQDLVSYFLN